ncbi:MAG: nucleoside kinase [Fidelibacterota bacterium]|nr:MAG: nucleoside kinase [Candidatus Neomarinimicrobiota bacterium]
MDAYLNDSIHPSAAHASLGFLLAAAVEELFPARSLFIEHSFIGGYYCHFGPDVPASTADLQALTDCLQDYTRDGTPLELIEIEQEILDQRFREHHRPDKLEILRRLGRKSIPAARFRHHLDYRFEPMTTNLQVLQHFSLDPYDHGFVMRFPSLLPPHEVPPLRDSPKLFAVIQQREEWGRALRVNNLCQLNRQLESDQARELVWVAEGLHEKQIAHIADELCRDFPGKRTIFIAGPSSSGKTTFAKRLAIQLKVNLFDTLALSMDNYFHDHQDMTPLPDGTLDFESLSAVDVPRLVHDVETLLDGRTIQRRSFLFKEGRGLDTEETVHLEPDAFLIVEGIHGLNPIFPQELGAGTIQRIYISAITQLNVDNEHRISSSDSRLLRRLVRDAQFRGHDAAETLLHWPRVRLGEEQHIFAYQEEADFMFNSALIYELAGLRPRAEQVLRTVPSSSPAYPEARRLLTFLSFVANLDENVVPPRSILREFLGHSAFEY